MLIATPGLVLHTVPYSESSVVAKVFTRQLGLRSYIVKGVRGPRSRVKQNMLQPLSSLDMVVYDSHRSDLNHVKELAPRHPGHTPGPVGNALRFFMTEVLYKTLREEEPMPQLWDYVEGVNEEWCADEGGRGNAPIVFLLNVARHLGIEPMDNHSPHEPYFSLDDGRYVGAPGETTLPAPLSATLHGYLARQEADRPSAPLKERTDLLNALLAYYQLHLAGFGNFHSHEILHTVLK